MANLKEYYEKIFAAQDRDPQKTARTRDADGTIPPEARDKLFNISAEIKSKFHELGSPMPPLLEGCTVLDLGCGTGRDSYLAAQLVGPEGKVIGIEPNADRLAIAKKYHDQEIKQFNYSDSNVELIEGYPEDLSALDDSSIDVVISNCVFNLSPDKQSVLKEVWRVLKEGGEFYFTDIFTDRRIPKELAEDITLRAARLSGALYIQDFRRLAQDVGFLDPRYLISYNSPLSPEEEEAMAGISYATVTCRLVKSPLVEDTCESFGEKVEYLGTLPDYPDYFLYDKDIKFKTGEERTVCGNVTGLLGVSRYQKVFKVEIDRSEHSGDSFTKQFFATTKDYEGVIDEDDQPIQVSCC